MWFLFEKNHVFGFFQPKTSSKKKFLKIDHFLSPKYICSRGIKIKFFQKPYMSRPSKQGGRNWLLHKNEVPDLSRSEQNTENA